MKNGKLIALSAISTALGLIFLIIGAYFPVFDISCLFIASVAVMLPLSKDSVKGAFLTYGATCLLTIPFVIGRFDVLILYALFFGAHPIANYFLIRKNKTFGALTFVKAIWFVGVLFFAYYLLSFFIIEIEVLNKVIPLAIIVFGVAFFIVYDLVMIRFQKLTSVIVKKLKL